MTLNLTFAKACKYLENFGYSINHQVPFTPFHLNVAGFRNKYSRFNHFDDVIVAFYQHDNVWHYEAYEATTLPGTDSMLKPVNDKGTAILVAGQYDYKLGKHQGKYEALVQKSKVKVYRDNNKDSVYDLNCTTIEEGFFGINIHRASLNAKLVGPDSAGCQVIKHRKDYESFISLCKKASNFWDSITYTLVEI